MTTTVASPETMCLIIPFGPREARAGSARRFLEFFKRFDEFCTFSLPRRQLCDPSQTNAP